MKLVIPYSHRWKKCVSFIGLFYWCIFSPLWANTLFEEILLARPEIGFALCHDDPSLKSLETSAPRVATSSRHEWRPKQQSNPATKVQDKLNWSDSIPPEQKVMARRWTLNVQTASRALLRLHSHNTLEAYLDGKALLRGFDGILHLQGELDLGIPLSAGQHELMVVHPPAVQPYLNLQTMTFSNHKELSSLLQKKLESMTLLDPKPIQDHLANLASKPRSSGLAIRWLKWLMEKNLQQESFLSPHKGKPSRYIRTFSTSCQKILKEACPEFFPPFFQLLHSSAPKAIVEEVFDTSNIVKRWLNSCIEHHHRKTLHRLLDLYGKAEGHSSNHWYIHAHKAYQEGLYDVTERLLDFAEKGERLRDTEQSKIKILRSQLEYRPPILNTHAQAERTWQEVQLMLDEGDLDSKNIHRLVQLVQPVQHHMLAHEGAWLQFSLRLKHLLKAHPKIENLFIDHLQNQIQQLNESNLEQSDPSQQSHNMVTNMALLNNNMQKSFQQGKFDEALGYAHQILQSANHERHPWAMAYILYAEKFLGLPPEIRSQVPNTMEQSTLFISGKNRNLSDIESAITTVDTKIGTSLHAGQLNGVTEPFQNIHGHHHYQIIPGKRHSIRWTIGHDMMLLRTHGELLAVQAQTGKPLWKHPLQNRLPQHAHQAPTHWEPLPCDHGILLTESIHNKGQLLRLDLNGRRVANSSHHPDYQGWSVLGQPGGGRGHAYVLLRETTGDLPVIALAKVDPKTLDLLNILPLKAGSPLETTWMGRHFHLDGQQLMVTPGDGLVLKLKLGEKQPQWVQNIQYESKGTCERGLKSTPLSMAVAVDDRWWVYLSEMQRWQVLADSDGTLHQTHFSFSKRWFAASRKNAILVMADLQHADQSHLMAIDLRSGAKLWEKNLHAHQLSGDISIYDDIATVCSQEGLLSFSLFSGKFQPSIATPYSVHQAIVAHQRHWLMGDQQWSVHSTDGTLDIKQDSKPSMSNTVQEDILPLAGHHWVAVETNEKTWYNDLRPRAATRHATKWPGYSLITRGHRCALLREPHQTASGWRKAKLIWEEQWEHYRFNEQWIVQWNAKQLNVYRLRDKALLWSHHLDHNKDYGFHQPVGLRSAALSQEHLYIQYHDGYTEERDLSSGEVKQSFYHQHDQLTQAKDGRLLYQHGASAKVLDTQSKRSISMQGHHFQMENKWNFILQHQKFEAVHFDQPDRVSTYKRHDHDPIFVLGDWAYAGKTFVHDLKSGKTHNDPHKNVEGKGVFVEEKGQYWWKSQQQQIKLEQHPELISWMKRLNFSKKPQELKANTFGEQLHLYDWDCTLAIIDLKTGKWLGQQQLGYRHHPYVHHSSFDFGFSRVDEKQVVWMKPIYCKNETLRVQQIGEEQTQDWVTRLKQSSVEPLGAEVFYSEPAQTPPQTSIQLQQHHNNYYHHFSWPKGVELKVIAATPDPSPWGYHWDSNEQKLHLNENPKGFKHQESIQWVDDNQQHLALSFHHSQLGFHSPMGFRLQLHKGEVQLGEYRVGPQKLKHPSNIVFNTQHLVPHVDGQRSKKWETWLREHPQASLSGPHLANALYHRRQSEGIHSNLKLLKELLKSHREQASVIAILSCYWLEKIAEQRDQSKDRRDEWSSTWLETMQNVRQQCHQVARDHQISEKWISLALDGISLSLFYHPSRDPKVNANGELQFLANGIKHTWQLEEQLWLSSPGAGPRLYTVPFSFIPRLKTRNLYAIRFEYPQMVVDFGTVLHHRGHDSKALIDPSQRSSAKKHKLWHSKDLEFTWEGKRYPAWRMGWFHDTNLDIRLKQELIPLPKSSHQAADLEQQLLEAGAISDPVLLMQSLWQSSSSSDIKTLDSQMALGLPHLKELSQFYAWAHWALSTLKNDLKQQHGQSLRKIEQWMSHARVPRSVQHMVLLHYGNIVKGDPLQLGPFDLHQETFDLQPLPEHLNWNNLLSHTWEMQDQRYSFSQPNSEHYTRHDVLRLHADHQLDRGLHYLAYKIHSPEQQKAYLYLSRHHIYSTMNIEIWINGKPLLEESILFQRYQNKLEQIKIELRKGVNALLIKSHYHHSISLKAHIGDRSGAPLEHVEIE